MLTFDEMANSLHGQGKDLSKVIHNRFRYRTVPSPL